MWLNVISAGETSHVYFGKHNTDFVTTEKTRAVLVFPYLLNSDFFPDGLSIVVM